MNLTTENVLLIGSLLLFASLLAGKTSSRFGVPVLIFFLVIGMLAGSEGLGGIHFNNPKTAQFIGIIGLNFILFSGGFSTDWKAVRPILLQGISLSTAGVMITAITLGLFMWHKSNFSIFEGLLLGSIVSSTDSAAVFSILRSKKLALKSNLRATLELESGSNDPMAYVLTIAFLGLVVNEDGGMGGVLAVFFRQLFLGGVLGFVFGKAGTLVINRIKFDYESLYVVLVIAIMFFSFSFTDFLGGNGFLAVYICGIYLGNQGLIHKRTILKTFDSYAWLMQIVLFLTLGLLVFPSQIVPQISTGLLCSAFLIFIARPVSVFASLAPFRVRFRDRLFISWVGLRGAVPIVFATYPLLAGAAKAQMIFNIVFFVSLSSVILQGTTLPVIAKWLHLTLPLKVKRRTLADLELEDTIKSGLNEVIIPEDSKAVGKQIFQLWLPKTALISIIQRNNKFITPTGSTVIQPNDRLFILSEDADSLQRVYDCLGVSDES